MVTRGRFKKSQRKKEPIAVPEFAEQTEKQEDSVEEQKSDQTLKGMWRKAEDKTSGPKHMKTAETNFDVENGILYRVYKTLGNHT